MKVAGDVERPGVPGDHADDRAEHLGLAFRWPAGPGGPAALGHHQGQVTEGGGRQDVPAVRPEQVLNDVFHPVGGDGPEDVGKEVQADVVEVGDELLPAYPG